MNEGQKNQTFVFCNMELRFLHKEELNEDVADVQHLFPHVSTAI